MDLFAQLKQRRVFRAIAGYGIVAFALLQIIEPLMHALHLPDVTLTYFVLALGLAFPVVVVVSWAFERLGMGDGSAPAGPSGTAALTRQLFGRPTSPAVVVVVAALAALVTFVAARTRTPPLPPQPVLSQLTFAEGIEEYPSFSPDGRQLLYVARSGPLRKIFRKDLESGQDEQLTHGDEDELQPYWSPDGQRILFVRAAAPGQKLEPGDAFGLFADGDVWQLELASKRESKLVSNAFNPAFSPDGSSIAVDSSWAGPRRIWLLDAQGHNPQQVTSDSSEEVSHVAPSFSPDGRKIAFQNLERTKFDIRVVNLDSKEKSWITNDFFTDIRPAWSPGGGSIYFTSDRSGGWNVWRAMVKPDGTLEGPLQQVTTGAGQDVEVALSRDGKRLAFATLHQNADIWRLPVAPRTGLATGPPQALISTTREDSRGAWAPDQSAIAFNSDRGGDMNIWIHALKDGSTRQLTRGSGGDFQPNWSPDAKKIAFFSSRSGTPNIWEVQVAGGAPRPLTASASVNANPFYSPDGRHIAFQSDRSGRSEVWLMNADGSEARQLTRVGVGGHFLRWTDAGDAVIFRCTCGGKPATLVAPIDGGDPSPFAEQMGGAHISLSPDRSRIMDVVSHRVLWVSPVHGGKPEPVFQFPDASVRIDYPVWSPDGTWVLFDRIRPSGGNIWALKGFE